MANSEAKKKAWREWYENNKESFNKRRRDRYMRDPVYRRKQIENARKTRKAKREDSNGSGVEVQRE